MKQQLTRESLGGILQSENVNALSFFEVTRLVMEEEGILDFKPDGICQVDPRNGERIVYNSARTHRPHDNRPPENLEGSGSAKPCVICQGKTTGVIDVANLSQGFSFINKNLFPVLFPQQMPHENYDETYPVNPAEIDPGPKGVPAFGLHFLQWTSSLHSKDWHNMPQCDRVVVMRQLAALERLLLTASAGKMPSNQLWGDTPERHGFVSIFKNYGRLVGGSLLHGHQQIGFSNIMPRRFRDNWQFEQLRGETFSAYLLRENPVNLLIRDYGTAVLVVPYFMRRPFDMILLVKDTTKRYLHQLTKTEIADVVEGWFDAIRTILWVMPQIGREAAYNVVTHNGPGAGLYFEFLPYTQEIGGYEQLGLYLCQGNPHNVAARIYKFLKRNSNAD